MSLIYYKYSDKLNLTIKSLFRYLEIYVQLLYIYIYIYIYIVDFDTSFFLWSFVSLLIFAVQYLHLIYTRQWK